MKRNEFETIYHKVDMEIEELLTKKNHDYADEDFLSNFKRIGGRVGMSKEEVALFFIDGKIDRIRNLMKKDKVMNESKADTVKDLIAYGFILYAMLKGVGE